MVSAKSYPPEEEEAGGCAAPNEKPPAAAAGGLLTSPNLNGAGELLPPLLLSLLFADPNENSPGFALGVLAAPNENVEDDEALEASAALGGEVKENELDTGPEDEAAAEAAEEDLLEDDPKEKVDEVAEEVEDDAVAAPNENELAGVALEAADGALKVTSWSSSSSWSLGFVAAAALEAAALLRAALIADTAAGGEPLPFLLWVRLASISERWRS